MDNDFLKTASKVVIIAFIVLIILVLLQSCSTPTSPPYPAPEIRYHGITDTMLSPYPLPVPEPTVFPLPEGKQILFPVYKSKIPKTGTESWYGTVSDGMIRPYILELNVDYVRMPMYWSDVEISPGVRVWPSHYDRDIRWLQSQNKIPIIRLQSVPEWAREPNSRLCEEPLDPSQYADFAGEVARRYQGEIVIEIGNEPNSIYGDQNYYGCWGEIGESDGGGSFYAKILELSYSEIKEANPKAFVLAGALMIPCKECLVVEPWINAWIDSPYYDGVSYHWYVWGNWGFSALDEFTDWLSVKTNGRPLWITETAVRGRVCDAAHEQRSVDWARLMRNYYKVSVVVWFFLPPSGWECVDLLKSDWSRKPVYYEWIKK